MAVTRQQCMVPHVDGKLFNKSQSSLTRDMREIAKKKLRVNYTLPTYGFGRVQVCQPVA
jgi:hypothetical protein